jgi:hypothetical protein
VLSVRDLSHQSPVRGTAQPSDTHGRGLAIVASVSHDWGVDRNNGTVKSVVGVLQSDAMRRPLATVQRSGGIPSARMTGGEPSHELHGGRPRGHGSRDGAVVSKQVDLGHVTMSSLSAKAVETGIHSSLSVPLVVGEGGSWAAWCNAPTAVCRGAGAPPHAVRAARTRHGERPSQRSDSITGNGL